MAAASATYSLIKSKSLMNKHISDKIQLLNIRVVIVHVNTGIEIKSILEFFCCIRCVTWGLHHIVNQTLRALAGAKEFYSLNSVLCFEHVSKFTFKASFPFISNISPISLSILSYPIRDVSDFTASDELQKGQASSQTASTLLWRG